MEFYSFQMALAIVVVLVTILMHWLASLVEKPEPNDDPSASPLLSAAPMMEIPEAATSAIPQSYDVFLSFRGVDTRTGILSHLYHELTERGIQTFKDDKELELGAPISPTLLKAIEKSKCAIVVLSKRYAESSWCLEELTKICQCMKDNNRILPVFYHVEPTEVRYQTGCFEEAFTKHKRRQNSEKVEEWRKALKTVANFSGCNTKDYKDESQVIQHIVESVLSKVRSDDIEFTCSGDFGAYEATREAMVEVMKALKDDDVTAVGVHGMGGVGKTTMVEHVGAEARKERIFRRVIMAVVSQNPNIERIQGRLAESLGVKLGETTEIGRAATLKREITRREKILIILDDVWRDIDLSRLGIPGRDKLKQCNSKILLTTRRLHVCSSMKTQASIHLHILSEQDSWSLFLKKTERSFEPTAFEDVAKRVAGECRGLPIALIAVARALRDKDPVEWQKAAQQLKKSQIANPDLEDDAFHCLKLSYDYLKNEDYKACFLLCCLFPEDSNIRIEDLFKYAIGKGLFQDTDTIYEARGIADSVVKHLIDSSLLLEGDSNYISACVRMHDVVRDTAMRIAKLEDGHGFLVKAGFGLDDWPCRIHEGYSAISLMKNKIRSLPKELVGPKLQILLLQQNIDLKEIPEAFSQSLNELKVLDLSSTDISLLPQSFSHLTNLEALYLDSCQKMIDISVLGKLTKLEILSMTWYPLKELSREIGQLINLRMLDIGGWNLKGQGIVTIPSKVISKLHRLEELCMLGCGFENWGSQIEGEGEETNIGFGEIAGLPKLKNLQVTLPGVECIPENVEVEPSWVYFDIRIGGSPRNLRFHSHYRSSRFLCLRETTFIDISTLPNWFVNAVTSKTEKLDYCCSKGISDIVKELDHGRFHELKHLRVQENMIEPNVEDLINTTRRVQKGPVFEKLEELHLLFLERLKELCVGELPPGSLSNLKVLNMFSCGILKNVSKFVHRLPNMEKLYLHHMAGLEYVLGCEGFEPKQSKLREMHLRGPMPNLKSIWSGPAPRVMLQSLKSVTIRKCEVLQCLFASDVAECLVQLEDLYVEECPLLERVIEELKSEKTVLPKLKNLVLSNLPKLYVASATADIECPSLKNLNVVDCSGLPFSITTDPNFEDYSEHAYLITPVPFEAFESNHFSFSTPASGYFGSTSPVKLNYSQLRQSLRDMGNSCLPNRMQGYEVSENIWGALEAKRV